MAMTDKKQTKILVVAITEVLLGRINQKHQAPPGGHAPHPLLVPLLQESLLSMKGQWQAELAGLKSETDRRRRLASYALKSRQEEEDIKALEFQSQQKLWALEQEQLAAAAKSNLQDMAATAAAALAAKQRSKAEEWAAEDRCVLFFCMFISAMNNVCCTTCTTSCCPFDQYLDPYSFTSFLAFVKVATSGTCLIPDLASSPLQSLWFGKVH